MGRSKYQSFSCLQNSYNYLFKSPYIFYFPSYFSFFVGISGGLDVLFAIDGSQSVDSKTFERIKELLKGTVKAYNVSRDQTRVGLITYGSSIINRLAFNNGISVGVVNNAIDESKRVGGKRLTTDALQYANDVMFGPANTRDSAKLLVLITTGNNDQTDSDQLKRIVQSLKRKNVMINAVAVVDSGQGFNRDEFSDVGEGKVNVVTPENAPGAITGITDASAKAVGQYNIFHCSFC